MWPVNHTASGSSQRDFTLDIDFDRFRKIMVRKNATEAIIAHSGMKLLNERVDELSIEIPEQKHPILNAVLGRSKADISASKQIIVSLENPDIDAKEMILNQHAQIDSEMMDVTRQAVRYQLKFGGHCPDQQMDGTLVPSYGFAEWFV